MSGLLGNFPEQSMTASVRSKLELTLLLFFCGKTKFPLRDQICHDIFKNAELVQSLEVLQMKKLLGWRMLMLPFSKLAFAGAQMPEIGPTWGAAALTIVACGLVVLRNRRK